VDDKSARAIKQGFGDRVRRLRQRTGLSQEKLADLAHLDRSYVGGVERGQRNVSLINIHKIAGALNVKPCALFP
jgi:transcriptional regulator with XRE-family HTH domain